LSYLRRAEKFLLVLMKGVKMFKKFGKGKILKKEIKNEEDEKKDKKDGNIDKGPTTPLLSSGGADPKAPLT
jgi:hypothetical protein